MPMQDHITLKRKDALCYAVAASCRGALRTYYDLSIEGKGIIKDLHGQGFILLPNHQSNLDIPFESVALLEADSRLGFYLMKGSLPKFYEFLGGISQDRMKEVNRKAGDDPELRNHLLRNAARQRERFFSETVPYLIDEDEAVVIHPQATRTYQMAAPMSRRNLQKILEAQKVHEARTGRKIPLVPLEITYENKYRPDSRVSMRFGEPIAVASDEVSKLEEHLKKENRFFE